MNKNVLIGGLTGGVAMFFLGWLIYGILLMDILMAQSGTVTGVNREEADFVWWALVLGNFGAGFLIAWVVDLTGNAGNLMGGAMAGLRVGLFTGIGFDFIMYGTTNLFTLNGALIDIAAWSIMSAIVGGIVTLVMKK